MLAVEAIERFEEHAEAPPRALLLSAPARRPKPSSYQIPKAENPTTRQFSREIATSCSGLFGILSDLYNVVSPLPLKGCVRNLPLSGRYCDPRDGSVVGGDVLRCIHR